MPAPDSVKKLIETFDNNIDFYKSNQYNEAQLRQEFLDPFFKELGWDMDNTAGFAPQYRDVIHEASIKIGGSTKAPDYAFSIHGQYKFFLEAKKPAVNVHIDTDPAYQLRRYGWSAKLPISILTDFEEFAIYDCRKRPKIGERASTSRLAYFKYTDYIEKWDELCATFSKEAILKGSFDKYTVDVRRHRGTVTVDDAFLEEIENWRNLLARNFALRNSTLSVRDLNFAVQKTIDRLIFLRFCEDRGIEDYKRLNTLLNGGHIYPRLLDQFIKADARYNSGLFHFSGESGRGTPDNITPNLELDDKVLKEIISKLYYPESPYEFSVMPADILGQVYEQFLGKTIRLTQEHRAKIEEKPEVRKAGGVYYTPSYIVDYIVKNTLGRQLDGDDPEKPKPIAVSKAAEIKVLDPACGSGSFLIVAYQCLLDWHLRQYTSDPETKEPDQGKIKRHSGGKNPKIYPSPDEAWTLTTDERKRILLNNIFGVDIDAQAVEVTKLSLLLKVIEGETHQIKQRDWIRERQRILPDLGNNIKCGNSLIGPDFYDNEQMLLLDEETQYRINVFDWNHGFPEIMQRGGFDCVIGNPPYGIPLSAQEQEYMRAKYPQTDRMSDSYCIFMVAASSLAKRSGKFSFIVPNTFCDLEGGETFRQWLLSSVSLERLWQSGWAFSQAVVDTLVFIASVEPSKSSSIVNIELPTDAFQIPLDAFRQNHLLKIDFRNRPELKILLEKVSETTRPLAEFLYVKAGVKLYEKGKGKPPQTPSIIENRIYTKQGTPSDGWQPLLRGKHIARYKIIETDEFVNYGEWIAAPRKPEMFSETKLLMRRTDDHILTAYDDTGMICVNSCHVIQFIELETQYRYQYFLALLNSRLMQYIFEISNPQMIGKVFSEIKVVYVKRLPIMPIDFNNPDDVAKHDQMVLLVERMLELNEKKTDESNPETLRLLETQITATDRQIDRLVYDLYDLTAVEVELVEQVALPDNSAAIKS